MPKSQLSVMRSPFPRNSNEHWRARQRNARVNCCAVWMIGHGRCRRRQIYLFSPYPIWHLCPEAGIHTPNGQRHDVRQRIIWHASECAQLIFTRRKIAGLFAPLIKCANNFCSKRKQVANNPLADTCQLAIPRMEEKMGDENSGKCVCVVFGFFKIN